MRIMKIPKEVLHIETLRLFVARLVVGPEKINRGLLIEVHSVWDLIGLDTIKERVVYVNIKEYQQEMEEFKKEYRKWKLANHNEHLTSTLYSFDDWGVPPDEAAEGNLAHLLVGN